MTGPHPSDLELFEYVEGELAESDASAIREHLESCTVCAAAVADSVTGRDALARSPQLELPDAAWQRALGSLGSQEREPDAAGPRGASWPCSCRSRPSRPRSSRSRRSSPETTAATGSRLMLVP